MKPRKPRSGTPTRRAFTLVESLAVIIVLSIAIPPAVSMMVDSAGAQSDAVMQARATWFASALLEQVMADVNSDAPGLGFAALDDTDAYLTTATTGFNDRNAALVASYNAMGLTHDFLFGDLADATGAVTGDADQDVFRTVTAEVTWTDMSGASRTLSIGCLATEL